MPARSKGEVRATGAFGHKAVAIIDFFVVVVGGGGGAGRGGVEGRARVPSVGLPEVGFGEVVGEFGSDARGGEEDVGGGDPVGGVCHGHWGGHFAHDGVDRRVDAQGFLDDLGVEGEFLEGVVVEGREGGAAHGDLFFV